MLSDNELNRCVAKFSSYSKSTLNFQAQNEAGEKIYVYYSDEEKKAGVGIKPIRRWAKYCPNDRVQSQKTEDVYTDTGYSKSSTSST